MQPQVPEGVKVRVGHLRRFQELTLYVPRGLVPHLKPIPKGGMTVVELERDGVSIGFGAARCSEQDNYCKAIGRMIATGRALKAAGLA